MNRKTQSIPQALERMAPHMEACDWSLENVGSGKWENIFWPTSDSFGMATTKARPLFIELVWHLAVAHPDPEAVKKEIRWYGDIAKLQRAQKINYSHLRALRWLNIDEQYDEYDRPEMPVQVYNPAGIR
mgnify:CR=1 FL=1